MRYAVIRDPDGWRFGETDVLRRETTTADRRLTATVRQVAAGQATAVPALAEFGVSMLVVRPTGTRALSGLADLDGVDRVPTSGAQVWRSQIPTGELVTLGPHVARTVLTGADLPANAQPRALVARSGRSQRRKGRTK